MPTSYRGHRCPGRSRGPVRRPGGAGSPTAAGLGVDDRGKVWRGSARQQRIVLGQNRILARRRDRRWRVGRSCRHRDSATTSRSSPMTRRGRGSNRRRRRSASRYDCADPTRRRWSAANTRRMAFIAARRPATDRTSGPRGGRAMNSWVCAPTPTVTRTRTSERRPAFARDATTSDVRSRSWSRRPHRLTP